MDDDESNLPASRLWQLTTARWFYVAFGGCIAKYSDDLGSPSSQGEMRRRKGLG
jgi:hypothetical protein